MSFERISDVALLLSLGTIGVQVGVILVLAWTILTMLATILTEIPLDERVPADHVKASLSRL